MTENAKETFRRHKRLPYTRTAKLHEPEEGEAYFLAEIKELPGVSASGSTRYEALYRLQQAFEDYLRAMIEWEEEIPEPEVWHPGDAARTWTPSREAGSTGEEIGVDADQAEEQSSFGDEGFQVEDPAVSPVKPVAA